MRTALISDIHGNHDGLVAVLADINRQNCDRTICLGDLIDGGEQSVEVVRMIRDLAVATVRGNHDETAVWRNDLPIDVREYLRALLEELIEDETLHTHSSPRIRFGLNPLRKMKAFRFGRYPTGTEDGDNAWIKVGDVVWDCGDLVGRAEPTGVWTDEDRNAAAVW